MGNNYSDDQKRDIEKNKNCKGCELEWSAR
jgi:hypothetical protein